MLAVHGIAKSFGTKVLFKDLSFAIEKGDRIGVIGPNGSGKSTLVKILAKEELPDEGKISYQQGMRIGYAGQSPQFPQVALLDLLVASSVAGNLHEKEVRASILLSKVGFTDFNVLASSLSGGWKKRLDIAKALMDQPDLLLLDEPTNHLDLEGIEWLEQFLQREKLTYLLISHDRYFLENCCNRIIEINSCYPGGLLAAKGGYAGFMEQREDFLKAQEVRERAIASMVRTEQDWLRRSPKARTTKSESRIQRAYALMDELSGLKQRNKKERVDLAFEASERETKKLLVAKNLGKSIHGRVLFEHLDLTLSPKMRLGIVGANGTGKTTLMRMLAGELPQDVGTVKMAQDLKIVYFDQHRESIPLNLTLKEALSPNSDVVDYHGRQIHVNGWAKRFLFSSDRLNLPVSCLSGGERARILIARLMLKPADLLFLDEPTNDLDIQTLEVLEESLEEFPGAVVLVTHDRCLMDRVATHILGLGVGLDHTLFADYAQWEEAAQSKAKKPPEPVKSEKAPVVEKVKQKLSYHEKKELEGLPSKIEEQEKMLAELELSLESKGEDAQAALALYREIAALQAEIERLYQRWGALENFLP